MAVAAGDGAAVNVSDAQYVEGKIVAVDGRIPLADGSLGYTTASVQYQIAATIGGRIAYFKQQTPQIRLWGPLQVLDADRLLGASVPGVMIGNELRWHFYEPPAFATCGAAPGAAGEPILDPNRRGVVARRGIDLPPIDGDPGNAAGGSGSGATGTTDGGIT